MKKNWEEFLQIVLLFIGTYGERCFALLHTLICSMSPEVFSFICLSMIFIGFVKLMYRQQAWNGGSDQPAISFLKCQFHHHLLITFFVCFLTDRKVKNLITAKNPANPKSKYGINPGMINQLFAITISAPIPNKIKIILHITLILLLSNINQPFNIFSSIALKNWNILIKDPIVLALFRIV